MFSYISVARKTSAEVLYKRTIWHSKHDFHIRFPSHRHWITIWHAVGHFFSVSSRVLCMGSFVMLRMHCTIALCLSCYRRKLLKTDGCQFQQEETLTCKKEAYHAWHCTLCSWPIEISKASLDSAARYSPFRAKIVRETPEREKTRESVQQLEREARKPGNVRCYSSFVAFETGYTTSDFSEVF